MPTARDVLLATLTEQQFQMQVVEWARRAGWKCHAMKDSRKLWWGVDRGFPDLFMVRGNRAVAAELKKMKGRLEPWQRDWQTALGAVPGIEAYVWWPDQEEEIKRILQ